jgi:hypothetical protein
MHTIMLIYFSIVKFINREMFAKYCKNFLNSLKMSHLKNIHCLLALLKKIICAKLHEITLLGKKKIRKIISLNFLDPNPHHHHYYQIYD